jgi:Cu+-exporting ATPase
MAGDSAPDGLRFTIRGMTCGNCARHVTEAIQGVADVASVVVKLEEALACVQWKPDAQPDAGAVIAAVKSAGFKAVTMGAGDAKRPASMLSSWKFNVILGGAVTLPLMAGEWFFGLGMQSWFQWAAFGLALPVQILCGARFYIGAWNQLKVGGSNMDTLVSLGSTTAFCYSAWALFTGWHGHLYFMESAAIITLISLGHWCESMASAKAAGSLKALLNLAPQTARLLGADQSESVVPASSLKSGDRVLLKPGDQIPCDGEVDDGSSAVDESMLTGESMPVEKSVGAKLFAGTLNRNGRLVLRVTATGGATALANIIRVVERAQSSRAQIQKLGDRVSGVFVPIVVLAAVATGLWWGLAPEHAAHWHHWLARFFWDVQIPEGRLASALIHAAGVLIVACPCAMGLATPAAIMAGTNVAARRGILIRDGAALEKAGTITAVMFDKTGTLTQGRVAVAGHQDFHGLPDNRPSAQSLAASLASPSHHPLSQAVAKIATPDVPLDNWREEQGRGVSGSIRLASGETAECRLGSPRWLEEWSVDLTPAGDFVDRWGAEGATVIALAVDRKLAGVFALKDGIKPQADRVVRQLQRQGARVYMVTGDHRLAAMAIAKQLGIPEAGVFAGIRPEEKAAMVEKLQKNGERVAFVGDGINDAPALERADLGIAVSQASDVAREAADIILLKSDIQAVPEALGLALATLATIKQNLFWAFFYNAAAIPLAMIGLLSPVICAAAMGLSDIVVIGNALRLQRWKTPSS